MDDSDDVADKFERQQYSQRSDQRARVTFYDVPDDTNPDNDVNLDSEFNNVSQQWASMQGDFEDVDGESRDQIIEQDQGQVSWHQESEDRSPRITFPAIRSSSRSESSVLSSAGMVVKRETSKENPRDIKGSKPLGYIPSRVYNGPAPLVKPAKVAKQSYAQMFSDNPESSPKSRVSVQSKSNSSKPDTGGVIRGNNDLLADLFGDGRDNRDRDSRRSSAVLPRLLSGTNSQPNSIPTQVLDFLLSTFCYSFSCGRRQVVPCSAVMTMISVMMDTPNLTKIALIKANPLIRRQFMMIQVE
jgi:hypothetical protein